MLSQKEADDFSKRLSTKFDRYGLLAIALGLVEAYEQYDQRRTFIFCPQHSHVSSQALYAMLERPHLPHV